MIRRGLKRLAVIVTGLFFGTALISLGIGAAAGAAPLRSVSLGFMLVGSFLFTAGAAFGLRGSVRPLRRDDGTVAGVRVDRAEGMEMMNTSVLFVGLGLTLVFVGILLDPHVRLV